jgi:NAD(P)-dependent dehydrogenase (short-subunit alcohol dehydrogenase family)
MKTALITGCSSGYGLEIARHFHAQGWNVVATMRTPRGGLLPGTERMRLLSLDVTRADSIAAAIDAAGPLDALVNNAGIGLVGAFEAMSMAQVRKLFETNTFGVMAMTQAVIPQFRARRSGVVVNVTSSVTLAPMPLAAAYTASKMAIEGFTDRSPASWRRSACAPSSSSPATPRPRASPTTPKRASRISFPRPTPRSRHRSSPVSPTRPW